MTDTSHVLLVFGVLSALSAPALAGPCSDRIAQIERSISMGAAGSGPTATGTVQGNASGATAGAGSIDTSSRLPANRPATPESAAAQTQSMAADQNASANTSADPNRLPANRPPSPESQAAAVEAGRSAPATGVQRNDATMALLSEARNLDQAGREADCMQSVSRIDQSAPAK